MRIFHLIFLLLLLVPLVELYLLIRVGGLIGAVPTLLLVVITAIVGAWLLRRQGLSTWARFQKNLAEGQMPAMELVEGPLLMLGGILLLTPGLLTDALGFACLIPRSRQALARYLLSNQVFVFSASSMRRAGNTRQSNHSTSENSQQGHVIEGEYRKDTDR